MGISCCAWTTWGNCSFFLFYSLSSFSTFSFYVFVTLVVLFLGASLVCVNNLKRTADLVLWIPDSTWHSLYNLIVLKVWLNLTNLNMFQGQRWVVLSTGGNLSERCVLLNSWWSIWWLRWRWWRTETGCTDHDSLPRWTTRQMSPSLAGRVVLGLG